jgi:hypothetical protein
MFGKIKLLDFNMVALTTKICRQIKPNLYKVRVTIAENVSLPLTANADTKRGRHNEIDL